MVRACVVLFTCVVACLAHGGEEKSLADATWGWHNYGFAANKQIADIASGKCDKALAFFEGVLKDQRADAAVQAEAHFALTLIHAQQKDTAKALASARAALDKGLPIERFLAGPREILDPLVASDAFKDLLKPHPVTLVHGPMLGRVTDTQAGFWVRTFGEATAQAIVSTSAMLEAPVRSAPVKTSRDGDCAAVLTVSDLKPDTEYFYNVLVNNAPALKEPARFKTFPAAGAQAKFSVAFGGGARFTPPQERMWDTVATRKPLALLLLGDNVYIDEPESAAAQRYCYYQRQSRPEFRRLTAGTAVFSIYDDHDFGVNDCSGGPDIAEPAWKVPAWRVFQENWLNPGYGGGEKQPGCWYDFAIGNVDFFMLDCRYYKDPKGTPPSMLGPVQKAWLLERLRASKGAFKVLASSVPWAFGTKPGSKDTWEGYEQEREEIFAFIEQHKIPGVILLSADRHRSDIWKIERGASPPPLAGGGRGRAAAPGGYDFYEFESSKLTNQHTHPEMKTALFSYNKKCSFGLLTFDTTAADPELSHEIVTIDGESVHKLVLKRSQLEARR